ncbi:tetratricopeptide repeat protein [Andreprevotia chitinilytica]|uniref:tetratricopeptide repeat protein n=1 Tax=Andreprevotia chitinilytica TaxID=396808 RepID=UPI000690CD4C|nr:tetratricopeptide repeat protein [Andreprevotia chitinilytica]
MSMTWNSLLLGSVLIAAMAGASASGGGAGGIKVQGSDNTSQSVQRKIDAKQWDDALEILAKARAKEPNNADWWNWTGYAERQRGHLPEAFDAYREALRLNPRSLGAHEYLGEAYLQNNQPDEANKQLAELQRLCGSCEQFNELSEAILLYKTKHP